MRTPTKKDAQFMETPTSELSVQETSGDSSRFGSHSVCLYSRPVAETRRSHLEEG